MRPASVVFAMAAAAQWIVPLLGVWQHERTIARGVAMRIECAAPDPYDLLRGRYLAVRPAQTRVPAPPDLEYGGSVPVWATLVTGDDGLARIESLSLEPVFGATVIQLKAVKSWRDKAGDEALLTWPFNRFYLNERLAPDADALVAERLRSGKVVVGEIRILDGRALLVDLLVDGVSIREVVKRPAQ